MEERSGVLLVCCCEGLTLSCSQLFGEPDADNDVSPETEEEEMETEGEGTSTQTTFSSHPCNLMPTTAVQNNPVQRISTRQWAENNSYDPVKLFHKVQLIPILL